MKLIKLQDKFILVSDEKIKEGDYKYHHVTGIRKSLVDGNYTNQFKIIAGIPSLPSIDFSLLSEEDCKTIGLVDVEKLAKEKYPRVINDFYNPQDDDNLESRNIWINGFKTAQSLNDKYFSLEDMELIFGLGAANNANGKPSFEKAIQSLQQTSWKVEVEMEQYIGIAGRFPQFDKPKITNNSLKIIKLL